MSAARWVRVWNLLSGTPNCLRCVEVLGGQPQRFLHRADRFGAQTPTGSGSQCARMSVRPRACAERFGGGGVEVDLGAAPTVEGAVRVPRVAPPSTRNSPAPPSGSAALTISCVGRIAGQHRVFATADASSESPLRCGAVLSSPAGHPHAGLRWAKASSAAPGGDVVENRLLLIGAALRRSDRPGSARLQQPVPARAACRPRS